MARGGSAALHDFHFNPQLFGRYRDSGRLGSPPPFSLYQLVKGLRFAPINERDKRAVPLALDTAGPNEVRPASRRKER